MPPTRAMAMPAIRAREQHMDTGTPQAPAQATQPAPAPAAPARPGNFAEAFSKAMTRGGSPAPTQSATQEPSAPSAPGAPSQEGGQGAPPQAPVKPRPAGIPAAAYNAERAKRQELQAQLAVQAERAKAMEAELAKYRQQPPAPQASAEDKWLAELQGGDEADPVSKLGKELAEMREWRQQMDARQQVAVQEQQDQALGGLLETLHDRMPHMDAETVDQFAIALLMAEPEPAPGQQGRSLDDVLLPLWQMHQKLTPRAAPKAPVANGAPAPKPPPQIGAPPTAQPQAQPKLKMGDFAKFVTDRLRQPT